MRPYICPVHEEARPHTKADTKFNFVCDSGEFTHSKCVTELIKLYLPRRDPRVAPSCLQERPNVTGIQQVNTQSQHTALHFPQDSVRYRIVCRKHLKVTADGRA